MPGNGGLKDDEPAAKRTIASVKTGKNIAQTDKWATGAK